MKHQRVMIAGGGAAGFFAAITCAEQNPVAHVTVCEATAQPLAKVRISGGGRCNVTTACAEPGEIARHYPTDIYAGRVLAQAIVKQLKKDDLK